MGCKEGNKKVGMVGYKQCVVSIPTMVEVGQYIQNTKFHFGLRNFSTKSWWVVCLYRFRCWIVCLYCYLCIGHSISTTCQRATS